MPSRKILYMMHENQKRILSKMMDNSISHYGDGYFMSVNTEYTSRSLRPSMASARGRATADNLAFPALGNGVGLLIQPSLTASASLRRRGNAWSLYDMGSAKTGPSDIVSDGKTEIRHRKSKGTLKT